MRNAMAVSVQYTCMRCVATALTNEKRAGVMHACPPHTCHFRQFRLSFNRTPNCLLFPGWMVRSYFSESTFFR